MEQSYLIDTNVIIDNFGDKLPEAANAFLNNLNITVSAVTKIEVLGWLNASEQQLNLLYDFMKLATILPIDEAVIEKTITTRQTNKIALGDAIIAATALVYNLTLITRNTKDFDTIQGLKVIDPWKI